MPMFLKSADAGAPALTGQDGSMYGVLKWALPQIGWSIEFDNNTDVIAFRNSALVGTGYYLRIDDAEANHGGTSRHAAVQVYSAMSDIDTGTSPLFSVERYLPKSTLVDSTAREWLLVGDARAFWLFVNVAGGGSFVPLYIGDFKPYAPDDPAPWVSPLSISTDSGGQRNVTGIVGIAYTATQLLAANTLGSDTTTDTPEAFALSYDGNTVGATCRLRSFSPSSSSALFRRPPGNTGGGAVSGIATARLIVSEGNAARGELLGGLNPLTDRPLGSSGWQIAESLNTGTGTPADCLYVAISPFMGDTSSRGSLFVDIESDWGDW